MGRIRCIKPEFWSDEKIAGLDPTTRLVFIGLWNLADDEGRLIDSVKTIDGLLFPETDDTSRDALAKLSRTSRIIRYQDEKGRHLIQIANWQKHQRIDHPKASHFPPPSDADVAANADSEPIREILAKVSRNVPKSERLEHGEHGEQGNRGTGENPPPPSGAEPDKPARVKPVRKQSEAQRDAHAWATQQMAADEPYVGNEYAARKALTKIRPEDREAFDASRRERLRLGKGGYLPLHTFAAVNNWRRVLPEARAPSRGLDGDDLREMARIAREKETDDGPANNAAGGFGLFAGLLSAPGTAPGHDPGIRGDVGGHSGPDAGGGDTPNCRTIEVLAVDRRDPRSGSGDPDAPADQG